MALHRIVLYQNKTGGSFFLVYFSDKNVVFINKIAVYLFFTTNLIKFLIIIYFYVYSI